MILHALNSYYERMLNDPNSGMPAFGTSIENISFALVLGEDGSLRNVEPLYELDGKKRRPIKLPVPAAVTRTSGVKANFIWDKAAYVFGADGDGPTEVNRQRFNAFKELLLDIGKDVQDPGFLAVRRFIETWDCERSQEIIALHNQPWDDVCNANLVFRLDGAPGYIHDRPPVQHAWQAHNQRGTDVPLGQCLITGEQNAPLARIHTPIKGVRGGQTSGGYIVSFNASAFVSYEQNKASVAESSAFAYTTALNALLTGNNRQKIVIGDTTYVFWASCNDASEEYFADLFDPPVETTDAAATKDDRETTDNIRSLLERIRDNRKATGFSINKEDDVQFYILGLAPNAARLSIRFWEANSLETLLERVGKYYAEINIVRQFDNEPEFPPFWRLLCQTATLGKSENVSPVLAGGMTRAILTGGPYPQSLQSVVLDRIRAEHNVTYFRAALLKAFLMRNNNEEVPVYLDPNRTDRPYLLGRLFAVLEKAQEEAIESNITIKDRYLASAAATPGRVFQMLLKGSVHHISKLKRDVEKQKRGFYFEKMIQEIKSFDNYPKTQSPEDQSLFMIGYYHQRKDLFTSKKQEG